MPALLGAVFSAKRRAARRAARDNRVSPVGHAPRRLWAGAGEVLASTFLMIARTSLSLVLGALLLTALSWTGCSPRQRDFGTGGGGDATTTGAGTAGGATTGTGGTGGGAMIPCMVASDCPGKETECQTRTCEGNLCGVAFAASGKAIGAQMIGDCHRVICDGKGGLAEEVDDQDVPEDSNPCTTDACADGVPSNAPVAFGSSCGGTLTCDSSGHCTGCTNPGECPGKDTDCQQRSCTGSVCGFLYAQGGTPVSQQTGADCKQNVCNGMGAVSIIFDPNDPEDDGNDCTLDGCSNGSPTHNNLAAGAPCAGGDVCNGNGACVDCLIAATCPGKDSECSQRACISGGCSMSPTPAGTAVQVQSPGDCAKNVCDGSGGVVASPDDGDVQDDGNQCTTDGCSAGDPTHTPVAIGTVCGPQQTCNAAGSCIGCSTNADCPGPDTECQSRACMNGVCGFNYVPVKTPVGVQSAGDCKSSVCNGAGGIAVVADNNDLPSDDNDCTDDVCSAGSPSNPPSSAGTACSLGGTVCNGNGQCAACVPGDSKYCCGIKTSFCCNNPEGAPSKSDGDPSVSAAPPIACCCGGTIDCDADGHWGPCF